MQQINNINKQVNLCIFLAICSMVPALWLPAIGEEGVYAISSQEMWYSKQFFTVTLYGSCYPRPPLYNWAILAVAKLLQTNNLILAARLVSILATSIMAAVLAWLTRKLWHKPGYHLLAAALFLSGDVLVRRGWLGYSDPIFACAVFSSIALLWVAIVQLQYRYLLGSLVCVTLGFLAKVHTAYIFYGLSALVIGWYYRERWKFWVRGPALVCYIFSALMPWLWTEYLSNTGNLASTVGDVGHLVQLVESWPQYLLKLATYPLILLWLTLPISALVFWECYCKRRTKLFGDPRLQVAALIVAINIIPYWISPWSRVRYLLPLMPFIALIFVYILSNATNTRLRQTLMLLAGTIVLNFGLTMVWYPYDQTILKGNAALYAREILQLVGNAPLYTNDSGAGGLRLAYELNTLRYPMPPLRSANTRSAGYILVHDPLDFPGGIVATYKLGGIKVYLKFYEPTQALKLQEPTQ